MDYQLFPESNIATSDSILHTLSFLDIKVVISRNSWFNFLGISHDVKIILVLYIVSIFNLNFFDKVKLWSLAHYGVLGL